MSTTLDVLKARGQDYFLAYWEGNELAMEPFCRCGKALDEDYFCRDCSHKCDLKFVLCSDAQTLSVVEKFIKGNPNFQKFEVSLLDQ